VLKTRDQKQKVILVSGVSSGIGKAIAELLVRSDYRVFGTSRNVAHCADIPGVELLDLDITKPASITHCIDKVLGYAQRIDVLINNAGKALVGGLEETSEQELQEQLDINFMGHVRLTQAVLPVMHRQHSGFIIVISSLLGQVSLPCMGAYSAAKFAVEGYFEALRRELDALELGVRVALIEPGFVRTNLIEHSNLVQTPLTIYTTQREQMIKSIKEHIARATLPEEVAKYVGKLIKKEKPRLRHPVGFDSKLINRLKRLLPSSVLDHVWKKEFGLF
jgi:short-subunit dehydrogenase